MHNGDKRSCLGDYRASCRLCKDLQNGEHSRSEVSMQLGAGGGVVETRTIIWITQYKQVVMRNI